MLSDYHGEHAKRGRGRPKGSETTVEEEDIGAIGRLLQKSLQRRREKNDGAASAISGTAVMDCISTIAGHDHTMP